MKNKYLWEEDSQTIPMSGNFSFETEAGRGRPTNQFWQHQDFETIPSVSITKLQIYVSIEVLPKTSQISCEMFLKIQWLCGILSKIQSALQSDSLVIKSFPKPLKCEEFDNMF